MSDVTRTASARQSTLARRRARAGKHGQPVTRSGRHRHTA